METDNRITVYAALAVDAARTYQSTNPTDLCITGSVSFMYELFKALNGDAGKVSQLFETQRLKLTPMEDSVLEAMIAKAHEEYSETR